MNNGILPSRRHMFFIFRMWICFFLIFLFLFFAFSYNFFPLSKCDEVKNSYFVKFDEIADGCCNFDYIELDNSMLLCSTNEEAWIQLNINEKSNYLFINIVVEDLKRNNAGLNSEEMQVYYATGDQYDAERRVFATLHSGNNVLRIPANYAVDKIRIDLVSHENVSFRLKSIEISNYFKILWFLPQIFYAGLVSFLIVGFIYIKKYRSSKYDELVESFNIKILRFFNYPYHWIKKFVLFIKSNKSYCIIISVIAILCYGLLCTYYTIYIDEERQINEAYVTYEWLSQGRFGCYLIERFLLVGRIYTPFLGDAIATILLMLSALVNSFTISQLLGNKHRLSLIIFAGLNISMPFVCGAYMVVGIYNISIGIGLLLTAISSSLILLGEGKRYIFWSILCLFISVSIYQAFVALFITQIVVYIFAICLREENIQYKKLFHKIRETIQIAIGSTIFYLIINQFILSVIVTESNYLKDSFVGWGKGESIINIFKSIVYGIFEIYTGSYEYVMGGDVIRISVILFCAYFIVKISYKKKNAIFLVLLFFLTFLSPFSLNIALGSTSFPGRTLFGIPVVIGCIWYILLEDLDRVLVVRGISYGISMYLLFSQIQFLNQFFWADYNRFNIDKQIANQIISDVRVASGGEYQVPLVIVGVYEQPDNGLTTSYELAGSYFKVDNGSISRMINFIRALGYPVSMPTDEQLADSYGHLSEMTCWPEDGSVIYTNGYALVKLSEPSQEWVDTYVTSYFKNLGKS